MACILCSIAARESPAHIVAESGEAIAFLDINPAVDGHTLVVSKTHRVNVFDAEDDQLHAVISLCKEVAALLKERLGCTGVNIMNASGRDAQQSVDHLHFHVVPRFPDDGKDMWFHGDSSQREDVDAVAGRLKIIS